jgi:hypothetical protein
MTTDNKYLVFRAVMLRNLARLTTNTRAYTSRLHKTDRDWVIERALWGLYGMQDWTNVQKNLTFNWDVCLRNAIASRAGWTVCRQDGSTYYCSFRILRAISPVGVEEDDKDAALH